MIEEISGNLLDSKAKYIAHQTNCTSTYAGGIANDIFHQYPYSDIYKNRINPSKPGSIVICGDQNHRLIINMNAQFNPGSYYSSNDSKEDREIYFQRCLNKIRKIKNLESIAFPYRIGCGLGGGDWGSYLKMIENFAKLVDIGQGAIVQFYKLPGA